MERDDSTNELTDSMKNFNSHAHVERDQQLPAPCQIEVHFNSHAHVERDKIERRVKIIENISTHTLTWSVTLDVMWNFLKLRISTHTLTWSVTAGEIRNK